MHEQRCVALLEQLEQRAAALPAGRVRERPGGHAGPGEAAIELRGQLAGVRLGQAGRGPGAELEWQRRRALVPGVKERSRGGGRQRLDAERGRERNVGALEPVGADQLGPQIGIVVRQLDGRVRLAGHLDQPAVPVPAQSRGLAPARKLGEQRLGPQVLVNVDLQVL